MSIILLAVLVLLIGVVTYTLMKAMVRPVRVVGACVLAVSLAGFMVQNRETIAQRKNFSAILRSRMLSDKRTLNAPNSTHNPGPVAYVMPQNISKEDHNFLDEILQKQNQDDQRQETLAPTPVRNIGKAGNICSSNKPVPKAELVINRKTAKRTELAKPNRQ
jgi:hypothetical protein